jgi:FolB domain-containing protein
MDCLSIKRLRVRTSIGVPPEERRSPQELSVSLEIFHPLNATATLDSLLEGIDYAQAADAIAKLATTPRKTIERFAEDIATMMIRDFRPAGGVRVTVCKKPPLALDEACVTITRP